MKVQDLMNRIRLGELSLPEFQREYVWDREQARQLLISLYREYPTGSLLFWDTMTPPAIKNQSSGQQSSSPKQIILDGQQRLTALYLLTQNEPPPYYVVHDIKHDPRSLVFDLATGEIGDARPEHIAPTLIPITDCFRGELDTIAIAQQMIGSPDTHDVAQLLQTFLFNLSRLRNILERDYPYQIVPITATLDDAIDVFDRINSQGTKLSAAELALTHISSKWPAARQTMKQRITELSAQRFDVDLDFMVRALVGVINERARLDTIHSTPAEYLIAGWKRLTDALTILLPLLAHHAAITTSADLASLDTLIPMLVHLGRHGGRFANQHTMRRAIRWLYLANIWMRYSSETTQRLDYDLSIVRRADNPWAELENAIIEQRGRTSIGPSDLEGCDVGHPLYRIVRVMLKARGAVDWFTALPLTVAHTINAYQLFSDEMVNADDRVQRKHLDEVANQVFLSSAPLSPLISQLEAIEARRAGTLAEHCIPLNSNLWQPSQFTQFLSARRSQLAQEINAYMQSLMVDLVLDRPFTLIDLINAGESAGVEFKSTLRWDVKRKASNSELEQEVAKTIAAFLNSEGGILVIGVQDNGSIYGIEHDMKLLNEHKNRDGFEVDLRRVVHDRMGAEYSRYIRIHFATMHEKTVCVVKVYRSPRPVMCTHKSGPVPTFFVRTGNSTQSLTPAQMNSYISLHWTH